VGGKSKYTIFKRWYNAVLDFEGVSYTKVDNLLIKSNQLVDGRK
jgi:hypothetical protein